MSWKSAYKAAFFLWIALIGVLSVVPAPNSAVTVSDKLAHFVSYFVTALLCYCAFRKEKFSFIIISGIAVFLYGIAIEFVQYFLPYRDFSLGDIAANASGIGSFILIWVVYSRVLRHGS